MERRLTDQTIIKLVNRHGGREELLGEQTLAFAFLLSRAFAGANKDALLACYLNDEHIMSYSVYEGDVSARFNDRIPAWHE